MAGEKILLIEDDREIQSTITNVLEAAGHNVHHAINGIEGQKRVEETSYDLIITDMMMPRMGGFPMLEFLKDREDVPPVIMITANEGGRHKAYAEMLGVAAYIRKPFAMELLMEAVTKALSGHGEQGVGGSAEQKEDPLKRSVRRKKTRRGQEEEG